MQKMETLWRGKQINWNTKLHSGDSVNIDNFPLTDLCILSQHYPILTSNYKLCYTPQKSTYGFTLQFMMFNLQNAPSVALLIQIKRTLISTDKSRILLVWVGQWKMNAGSPISFFIHLLVYMDSDRAVFKVLYKNCISWLSKNFG